MNALSLPRRFVFISPLGPTGCEVASFLHITAKATAARSCDLKSGLGTEPGPEEGKQAQVCPMADFQSTQK